jgi:hypothetical protein
VGREKQVATPASQQLAGGVHWKLGKSGFIKAFAAL